MLTRLIAALVLALVVATALAACARTGESANPTAARAVIFDITMTEMRFEPARFTVPAGAKVTMRLKNAGIVTHDFTIDSVLGVPVHEVLQPGQTDRVSFAVPMQPQTIEFYCSQAGHRQAGMHGTIVVQ